MAELIVGAAIMAVLVLIMVVGLTQNYSILQTSKVINNFQNDARIAIIKIAKDLRRTTLTQIAIQKNIPSAGCDKLTYHLPLLDANNTPSVSNGVLLWDSNSIVVLLDANNAGNLIRTDASGTTILARNVKYITFNDINNIPQLPLSELKIALGFQATSFGNRTLNYNSTTVINMRN